jgi:hypothetical protein
MIWQLMRREPLWPVIAMTGFALLWGVLATPETRVPLAIALVPALLLMTGATRHVDLFEASLPIAGRTLIGARLLRMVLTIWAPLLAAAAVGGAGWLLAAATVVTTVGIFALTARVETFDERPARMVYFWVASMGAVAVVGSFTERERWIALAFGVVGAVRLAWVWPRIPAGFQAAPREARGRRGDWWPATPVTNWAAMPMVRGALPWQALLMLPVVMVQAAVGSWTFGVIFFASIATTSRRNSRWMWGLPISRRTILGLTIGPYLACLMVGMALSAWVRGTDTAFPVSADDDSRIPVECWRFAWGSSPPVTWSPTGESVMPRSVRFPGFVVYDPYTVGWRSSKGFVEWQFQRATEAMYGEKIEGRTYSTRKKGLRPVSMRFRGVVMTMGIAAALALFGIWCFTVLEWRWFGRLSKAWRGVVGTAALILAFAPLLAMDFYSIFTGTRLTSSELVGAVALRAAPALVVALVVAAYALVDWQFRGVELGARGAQRWKSGFGD